MKLKRIAALILTLALLLTSFAATAEDPVLRVWCNNLRVSTGADGLPTGIMFTIGAQYGYEGYSFTYSLTGATAKSGAAAAGVNNIIADFAPGSHTLEIAVKDAVNATATTTLLFTYNEDADGKGSITGVTGASGKIETPPVKVQKITLTPDSLTLRAGGTAQLTPTIEPSNAASREVYYDSSSPGIASVDQNGLVTAHAAGSAIIHCMAKDGSGVEDSVVVTVTQGVTGISMSPAAITMAEQETRQLNVTVTPDNAANKKVTYSSSNTAVATVSSSGLVMAVKEGVATITVVSEDDNTKKATCIVTVGVPVSTIDMDLAAVTLVAGKSITLQATVLPTNATNTALIWSTSDEDVATVSGSGKVTAWKAGTATITAKAADGSNVTGTCVVTVTGEEVSKPTTAPTTAPTTKPTTAPTAKPGTPSGTTARVYTEKGRLNMRSRPSSGATIVERIPENGLFTVIEHGSTWCYAYYNGTYGYVMTKFLTYDLDAPQPGGGSGSAVTPVPGGSGADAPTGQVAFVHTEQGRLNLRAKASTGAKIIDRIPEDGQFIVISYGKTWCYAWYDGNYGYVMTKFVRLAGETELPSTPETPDKPADPTPAPDGNAKVVTKEGGLNLRVNPSKSSRRILVIPRGAYLNVLTIGKTWCYVEYDGQKGYAMTEFLRTPSGAPLVSGSGSSGSDAGEQTPPDLSDGNKYAQVTTEQGRLNLRNGPSKNNGIIARIPQNAYVQVKTYGKTWCYVEYNGLAGYVMTEFLTMM